MLTLLGRQEIRPDPPEGLDYWIALGNRLQAAAGEHTHVGLENLCGLIVGQRGFVYVAHDVLVSFQTLVTAIAACRWDS